LTPNHRSDEDLPLTPASKDCSAALLARLSISLVYDRMLRRQRDK